jgi:hypothetical protein
VAQGDPIDRPESDDSIGAPDGTRQKAPLEFPRREQGPTINIWRTSLYFVLVVIVLALIAYYIVHPR